MLKKIIVSLYNHFYKNEEEVKKLREKILHDFIIANDHDRTVTDHDALRFLIRYLIPGYTIVDPVCGSQANYIEVLEIIERYKNNKL